MAAPVSDAGSNKIVQCEPYMSYDPLPEGYVRLLKIHTNQTPWNTEEEIEISLISVPLAECPPYVTLSYTWGDPEPFVDPTTLVFTKVPRCFPIKCRGRLILGTRNLRNALRQLRQYQNIQNSAPAQSTLGKMGASMARYNNNIHLYWIDAICIDQDDLQERSAQVLLMSKIYRQCRCTLAWLGEQDAYTRPAVQVLLKVVGGQIARDSYFYVGDSAETEPEFKGIDTLNDAEIEALAMVLARKWISRTWILQEVLLSPSVLTLWGEVFFSFDILVRVGATLSISRAGLRLWGRFSESFKQRLLGTKQRLLGTRSPSTHLRILGANSTLAMIHSHRLRLRLERNRKLGFMDAVLLGRGSESTDPRDRIYGLLGIAAEFEPSGQVIYKPEYRRNVVEVYTTATAFVIRSRGDLACLTLVCDSSMKNIKNLPSWCPDYSTSVPALRDFSDVARTWQLGLSWSDALIPEILETSILRVDGCLFDVVAETSSLLKGGPNSSSNHGLSAIFNLATQLEDQDASISITSQHHKPFEKLWRTLILDQFDNEAPAPARTAHFVPALIPYLLLTIYRLNSEESDEPGIAYHTTTHPTQESVFEELETLESIVDRLEGDRHDASPGLPDFDRMRNWIEYSFLQRSSDTDYTQTIIEGLASASTEEVEIYLDAPQPEGSAVDPSTSGTNPSDSESDQDVELIQRNLIDALGSGRFKRVYFRTRNTLGTGQPSVRAGDEVWLLNGAYAPVILRSLDTGNYRFMGEAYVHGIMYGEAGVESRTHRVITIE